MKVNNPNGVMPLSALKASEASPRVRSEDRVTVQDRARLKALSQAAREVASQEHVARLADIEARVKSGTYQPDPRKIAEEILRSAELHARIQAILE